MTVNSKAKLGASAITIALTFGLITNVWARTEEGMAAMEKGDYKTAMREAAEQGDVSAQFQLGQKYYFGEGVPRSTVEAANWYRKAAEKGLMQAQFSMGVLYQNGEGVPRDSTEAAAWYRKAAEQGYTDAQHNLGLKYERGDGVPKDMGEALSWYRKAADRGHPYALNNLAVVYRTGNGIPANTVAAYALVSLAAAANNEAALRNLKAAEGEMTPAQLRDGQALAVEMAKPGNMLKALDQYLNHTILENQVFAEALRFVAAREFNRAVPLLEQASSSGSSRASFFLGLLYEHGKYIEKDEVKAERYLKASSAESHTDASFELAEIYSRRNSPDEESIKRLVLLAAKYGKVEAIVANAFMKTGMLPSKAVKFRRLGDYDWSENFIDSLIPVRLPDGAVLAPDAVQAGYAAARRDCIGCHLPGLAGAPKLGDRTHWEKRKIDVERMSKRVLDGYKKCPPVKKNHSPMSLEQIKAAIHFMIWTAFK